MNVVPASALSVEGLALSFGGIRVLQDIDVRFQSGEITGLIGPNGAGKTSFFNCLTGLYRPQQGRIRLGDKSLEKLAPSGRALMGFSRSFQHVALCAELNVVENVMIGLHRQARAGWLDAFLPLGTGRTERESHRELALEALARLGIAGFAQESPAQLAPGVLRLAEIARAIVGALRGWPGGARHLAFGRRGHGGRAARCQWSRQVKYAAGHRRP